MSFTRRTTISIALDFNYMSSTRQQLWGQNWCFCQEKKGNCMYSTRHATTNVAPDCNPECFVRESCMSTQSCKCTSICRLQLHFITRVCTRGEKPDEACVSFSFLKKILQQLHTADCNQKCAFRLQLQAVQRASKTRETKESCMSTS